MDVDLNSMRLFAGAGTTSSLLGTHICHLLTSWALRTFGPPPPGWGSDQGGTMRGPARRSGLRSRRSVKIHSVHCRSCTPGVCLANEFFFSVENLRAGGVQPFHRGTRSCGHYREKSSDVTRREITACVVSKRVGTKPRDLYRVHRPS